MTTEQIPLSVPGAKRLMDERDRYREALEEIVEWAMDEAETDPDLGPNLAMRIRVRAGQALGDVPEVPTRRKA